jgi:hypothetical protein
MGEFVEDNAKIPSTHGGILKYLFYDSYIDDKGNQDYGFNLYKKILEKLEEY